jgi:hypothetical protein
MMNGFDSFLPYFNIFLGTLMTLIGFKIYKPFAKEKAEDIFKKYGGLYKYGGLAMLIYGVITLLIDLKLV